MDKKIYMKLGFPEICNISGMRSISKLYPENSMGIYLLKFPDGTYYIGQTVDLVKRFTQHLKEKGEITGISFMPVSQSQLNFVEQQCISALENSCQLRNISLVSTPVRESCLDSLLSVNEQQLWLNTNEKPSCYNRICDDNLRSKYKRKFYTLQKDPVFYQYLLPVMQHYMLYCIPEPFKTEISFWGCSCLPGDHHPSLEICSRVNIHTQEVFTVGYYVEDSLPFYSFHVTKSLVVKNRATIKKFYSSTSSFEIFDHFYPSGGADQCQLVFKDYNEVLEGLKNFHILNAIKDFNLRNMRKGVEIYSRYHCMDLADLILPSPL